MSYEEDNYSEDESYEEKEEETLDRDDLIRQIEDYHREFPEILNNKDVKKAQENVKKVRERYTDATSTEKIKEDLELIKVAVGGKNMGGALSGLCVPIAMIIEHVGSEMGLKLNGPSKSLTEVVHTNRTVFESCIKEIVCKYGLGTYMQPEVRLAIALGSCVLSVHTENTTAEKASTVPKSQIPQPTIKQENDGSYKE